MYKIKKNGANSKAFILFLAGIEFYNLELLQITFVYLCMDWFERYFVENNLVIGTATCCIYLFDGFPSARCACVYKNALYDVEMFAERQSIET